MTRGQDTFAIAPSGPDTAPRVRPLDVQYDTRKHHSGRQPKYTTPRSVPFARSVLYPAEFFLFFKHNASI